MNDANLTHAGGVVRRDGPGGPQFLLVRASRPPFDWVLPKGHIEEGETPEQAAEREVAEEAGVHASIDRAVGDLTYEVRGQTVYVRFFAMEFRVTGIPMEQRETAWCSLEECVARLPFETARDIVRRAADR